MSKYTRQQVINERKCGLKLLDKAVEKVGFQAILEETVTIFKDHPNTWGPGWPTVKWAFGNAWRDVLWKHNISKGEIASTANLDEALTLEQMQWLASQLGLNMSDYKPGWDRRPPGKEIVHREKRVEGVLTTNVLKKLLQDIVTDSLNDANSALRIAIEKDGFLKIDELIAEKRYYDKSSWTRTSKCKDVAKNNIRVFSSLLLEATITSDCDDVKVLDVLIQIGPAWEKQPPPVKLPCQGVL